MIEDYMNQVIEMMEAPDGYDAYGKPKYKLVASDVPCTWQGKVKLVPDKTGKEVIAQAEIRTQTEVSVDYRLTYQGKPYTVISVREAVGMDGELDYRQGYV